MNKSLITLVSILFAALFLAGCNNDENSTTVVSTNKSGTADEVPENAVRLTISINHGEQFINEQQVEIEEGANLLETLEETFFIETNEESEITSIERVQVSEEENTYWHLYIDGEMSDVPVKDITLQGGEKIVFDLQ